MQNYFKETELILNRVEFDHLGGRYSGRGVMTWNPEQGFHVEAPLDLPSPPRREPIEFGRFGVISKKDLSSIRLFPSNYDWAISPAIPLVNRYDVIHQKRLSINLDRVIFTRYHQRAFSEEFIYGSALFETNGIIYLSDELSYQESVQIKDKLVFQREQQNWRGIYHEENEEQYIIGYLIDERYLRFNWKLPRSEFTKTYSWKLAEAIQYSLSILLGQSLTLLKRDLRCGEQERIEIRQKQKVISLDFLRLMNNRPRINKEHFLRLTEFIAKDEKNSQVCCRIFQQLLEAVQQSDWQIQEFVVSSILEAALRNIDNQPFSFKKGKSQWDTYKGLQNFFDQFLSNEWADVHQRVKKEFNYLRDRTAHPDWLFTQGGALSEAEMEKSLDSMLFLSRFYGYMILSLAGFQNLKPSFPLPHTEWTAPMIITPARSLNDES